MNGLTKTVLFTAGSERVRFAVDVLASPTTASMLPKELVEATADADLTVVGTTIAYPDNYFWEAVGNRVVVSFSG